MTSITLLSQEASWSKPDIDEKKFINAVSRQEEWRHAKVRTTLS